MLRTFAAALMTASFLGAGTIAAAPLADRPITSMAVLWKWCDQRDTDPGAYLFCFAYIVGNLDAAIVIGKFTQSAPLCMTPDNHKALFERILSYVPNRIRGDQDAATFVQGAILDALRCP